MSFNTENFNRLRAYLLTREGKFNWGYCGLDRDDGCIACACVTVRGVASDYIAAQPGDIQRFVGCSGQESEYLFYPAYPCNGGSDFDRDVHAAIARLDAVATKYGVTPEPPASEVLTSNFTPDPDAFLADLRQWAASVHATSENAR